NWLGGPPTGPARAPAAASNKAPAITRTATIICHLNARQMVASRSLTVPPRDHGGQRSFRLVVNEAVSRRLRLTTYKLRRADAERQFPGAEPDLQTSEVRMLPEPGELLPNTGRGIQAPRRFAIR